MVKGTVTISIEDFQALVDSGERAQVFKDRFTVAKKELQVFLSFLATRADLEKYIDEFNRQSKTSKIIFEGTTAKIELKNEETTKEI